MRKLLIVEGQVARNGLFVEKGAVQFNAEEKYPLMQSDWSQPPIGFMSDIQRDDNSKITAEVTFRSEELDEDDFELSMYCTGLAFSKDDKNMVLSAKLRGATIVQSSAVRSS